MERIKKIIAALQDREQKKTEPKLHEREMRELLRENLKTVAVDVFYYDDPLLTLNPEERKTYLTYFNVLVNDKKLIDRLKFFVNKQANITLKESIHNELDVAGVMKMDGINTVIDDMKRLSAMYLQEEAMKESMSKSDALRL